MFEGLGQNVQANIAHTETGCVTLTRSRAGMRQEQPGAEMNAAFQDGWYGVSLEG